MQSLVAQVHSRTGRWVAVLLVLVVIYIYVNLSPPGTSTEPSSERAELDKLEQLLKDTFKPRIDRIGPQERVERLQTRQTTIPPGQNARFYPQGVAGRTTAARQNGPQLTTRPSFDNWVPARTTTAPAVLSRANPSGHFKVAPSGDSSGNDAGLKTVSDTGVSIHDLPNYHAEGINCARIVEGDPNEIYRAQQYQESHPKIPRRDSDYIAMAQNCPVFKQERRYLSKPVSKEEEDFSIAFSIMVFKDFEQTERLLRAIYRPQNYYCIHVDKKSSLDVHRAAEAVSKCFDNVFLAPRPIDVQWGWFSVLEPDLQCMEELYNKYRKWRYFINLTGQEFPLKTNLDLVRILRVYNGTNNMEGTVARRNTERTEYVHEGFFPTNQRKRPPPAGVTITKGSVHITASRAFVDYVLNNRMALKFREWVKDSGVPDETFFSSLNYSPQLKVPGAYKGTPETDPHTNAFMTRFKNWGTWPFDYPCSGQRIRMICIFGVGDVHILSRRPELFANKFYLTYEPLSLDCMEELHYNRTRQELQGMLSFDTNYYKQLAFVKNHI